VLVAESPPDGWLLQDANVIKIAALRKIFVVFE
jgi:hypothetical protein